MLPRGLNAPHSAPATGGPPAAAAARGGHSGREAAEGPGHTGTMGLTLVWTIMENSGSIVLVKKTGMDQWGGSSRHSLYRGPR